MIRPLLLTLAAVIALAASIVAVETIRNGPQHLAVELCPASDRGCWK